MNEKVRLKIKLKRKIYALSLKIGVKMQSVIVELSRLNPLDGDRCIEYAFIVKNLLKLDKEKHQTILDIGCVPSPLTTIMEELGFNVDGIDLRRSPLLYDGVNYIQGDFLSIDLKNVYDIIVLCSTIEHIGLGDRFGSENLQDGDIKALEKVKKHLAPNGILLITLPYGEEKIIKPVHRVYNKNSKLLKYAYNNFEITSEEFFKNNDENIWVKCEEAEARTIKPSQNNYALGLFAFINEEV